MNNTEYTIPHFLQYLANKYNCEMKITGSYGTYLEFSESDIDCIFYCYEPSVVYHKLRSSFSTADVKQNYLRCIFNETHISTVYKTNVVIHDKNHPQGKDVSIMLIAMKDKQYFEKKLEILDKATYYFGFLLYILKVLYYKLHILPDDIYKKLKYAFFSFFFKLFSRNELTYRWSSIEKKNIETDTERLIETMKPREI